LNGPCSFVTKKRSTCLTCLRNWPKNGLLKPAFSE
jgi:hypothetical protein